MGGNREEAGAVFYSILQKPTQNYTKYQQQLYKKIDNQMLPSEQRNSLKRTDQQKNTKF